MSPEQINIVLEELARLREEVVNTRNVTIKTDNLIKNLSGEVKAITTRQTQQERKSIINSVGAYVLFVIVIFAGLQLSYQARLEKQQVDQALFDKKEASYKREVAELKADLGRWKQIERELLEFERLVRDGNKEEAVAKFSGLRRVSFAGLLENLIVRFRSEVSEDKFKHGIARYKEGSFHKADEAFIKSLEYNEAPDYLGRLLYLQGMSALQLKDYPRAAELLRKALGFNLQRKDKTDASYHLAVSFDRMGEKRTARDLYHRFYQRHEKHRWSRRAKQRYKQLKER